MEKLFKKKNIIIGILIIDAVIGYLLFNSRLFSHLAIWDIIESDKKEDFYWQPDREPKYFNFEQNIDRLEIFKKDILPLIQDEKDEFKIILKIAQFVQDMPQNKAKSYSRIKWDSPEMILKQVKEGTAPNCFYSAILFSEYLASIGIKSRLWALENEKFDRTAHTIAEVYVEDMKSWIFFDTVFGFYAMDKGQPLSFLEFREKLLSGKDVTIAGQGKIPGFYKRLARCAFLRANNNFIGTYNNRYGIFSAFSKYLDKFPDNVRRGLSYLLGGQKHIFIHYMDDYSKSLKQEIFLAKLFFWFFISSPAFIGFIFAINLSTAFLFLALTL